MSYDIEKKYDYLLQNNEIEFDQKQFDLLKELSKKSTEFFGYINNHSILSKIGILKARPPKGIYIYGQVGRGKSMLMDLFYNSIDIKEKRRVHFNAFMNEVHDEIFKWRQKTKDADGINQNTDPVLMVAKLIKKNCKLLCFDEFQVEDIADAMILGRLFKILFEMGILVISTSNIHPRNLYLNGLNRDTFLPFIDKLEENMDVYNLEASKDYRMDRIKDTKVYFFPDNEKNQKYYIDTWQNLIGSIEVSNRILTVKGRELLIDRSAGKYALFSYVDLCVKPLGVADYIEIAKNYDVIFISNIPVIDPKKRNEIKRFINLIDTFYETKKILFILAETAPKDIMIGGKDDSIFQRTVSRLEEMQSAEYLNNIIEV